MNPLVLAVATASGDASDPWARALAAAGLAVAVLVGVLQVVSNNRTSRRATLLAARIPAYNAIQGAVRIGDQAVRMRSIDITIGIVSAADATQAAFRVAVADKELELAVGSLRSALDGNDLHLTSSLRETTARWLVIADNLVELSKELRPDQEQADLSTQIASLRSKSVEIEQAIKEGLRRPDLA